MLGQRYTLSLTIALFLVIGFCYAVISKSGSIMNFSRCSLSMVGIHAYFSRLLLQLRLLRLYVDLLPLSCRLADLLGVHVG